MHHTEGSVVATGRGKAGVNGASQAAPTDDRRPCVRHRCRGGTKCLVPARRSRVPCRRSRRQRAEKNQGTPKREQRHMPSFARSIVVALGLLAAGSGALLAADYPTRPVRWIVPYPAGGTTDILARIIGQYLSEHLGQQFVIENRPGGGNNIGTEAVVHAAPDGYTLLLVNPAHGINATLYPKLSFNFIRDIAPVAGFMRVPNVMEIHPSIPAKTVAEFIAYAKANPGKINWASSGNGTSVHLSGELFKSMTGVEMANIPYKG